MVKTRSLNHIPTRRGQILPNIAEVAPKISPWLHLWDVSAKLMFATHPFTKLKIMSVSNFKEIPWLMNLGWHSEFFEFLQHCSCQMLSKENTGQK